MSARNFSSTYDLQEKYGENPKCDRLIARQDKLIPSALNVSSSIVGNQLKIQLKIIKVSTCTASGP